MDIADTSPGPPQALNIRSFLPYLSILLQVRIALEILKKLMTCLQGDPVINFLGLGIGGTEFFRWGIAVSAELAGGGSGSGSGSSSH